MLNVFNSVDTHKKIYILSYNPRQVSALNNQQRDDNAEGKNKTNLHGCTYVHSEYLLEKCDAHRQLIPRIHTYTHTHWMIH